ncbi:nardilysin-like isoform X1 [Drosophila miranda]|uniref:nardilysin-like isoform X1 n=1 Tax=Drosophila miranda TaxID=7229 RepID=UPI00143F5240|nr:nardilysin-like isoform X1 [Drosophila miranda]
MAENVDIEIDNLQVAMEPVFSPENLETDVPDQSENDKKSYKSILLQNGLKALIVSDPDPVSTGDSVGYKTAALALTVDCGSFKDPQNFRGLTHVLEHLLHMDGIFTSHVKQCGGFSNVRADCEETMFYFEVPELHLTSTLLHLTALLIKQDVLERERLPIIADLRQEVEDYQAQRNLLLASLAADNYPHGLYDWDNLAELKEKDPEDALAAMIQQLRRDNYAANHMHVCLQASLSLKELEKMICRHFGVIPSNGMESVNLTRFDYRTAFRPEFHENVFYVTSSDGGCRLDLTWLLPSVRQYYRSKPEAFLAYLLSQEGPGSLCVYLRHRRWSVSLLAGVDDNGFNLNSIYSLFKLSIHLTDEGYKHIDGVLAATFAYIKLIAASDSAVLRPLYDKQQLIEEARFRFQTHRTALYNVQDLVLSSKYYPGKDVLTARGLYYEYSDQHMSEMIGFLNKMDFNMVITSGDTYVGDSPSPMPDQWKKLWHEFNPIEELCLPEPNAFVAEDFRIFWLELGKPDLPPCPKKLMKTNICELWYRLDDKFGEPKASMSFYFISPLQRQSARK